MQGVSLPAVNVMVKRQMRTLLHRLLSQSKQIPVYLEFDGENEGQLRLLEWILSGIRENRKGPYCWC